MKNRIRQNKKLFIKLCVTAFFVVLFIVFVLLKMNKDICEWWTRYFYGGYSNVIGRLTKYLPFSLFEVLMIAFIVLVIVFLVQFFISLFKKTKGVKLHKITNILIMIFSVLSIYQMTAEMAYNRDKIPIALYEEKVEKTEYKNIVKHFINDMNMCINKLSFAENNEVLMPYSLNELNEKVMFEYSKLSNDYFASFTSNIKPMFTSFIYREFHIVGVSFLPTVEANVNALDVNLSKPFTAAHEIAHTKGVMRESDADLLALYLMLNSDDYFLRMSGYFYSIGSIFKLSEYTGVDTDREELLDLIDEKYFKYCDYAEAYWDAHKSGKELGNWINNLYLLLSGVPEGTDSYRDNELETDVNTGEITSYTNFQKIYLDLFF